MGLSVASRLPGLRVRSLRGAVVGCARSPCLACGRDIDPGGHLGDPIGRWLMYASTRSRLADRTRIVTPSSVASTSASRRRTRRPRMSLAAASVRSSLSLSRSVAVIGHPGSTGQDRAPKDPSDVGHVAPSLGRASARRAVQLPAPALPSSARAGPVWRSSARQRAADPGCEKVAQAHHATDRAAVNDREVTEPVQKHDLGRVFRGHVRAGRLRVGSHPLRNPRC